MASKLDTDSYLSVGPYFDMLGKTARDRVTGLAGVVSSVSFDLYGCVQFALTPPVDKDGKVQDGRWIDANRLEITDHTRVMPVPTFQKLGAVPEIAAIPAQHAHGPAEKGAPK